MYYLQSRYYDPETGRFITADRIEYLDLENVNGLNLYAYCGNNPVMCVDPSGNSATLIFLGIFLVGFSSSLFINAATNNWQLDWRDFAQASLDGLFAAGSTILALSPINLGVSIGIGAAMGWGQYALGSAIQETNITVTGSITALAFGALGGAISGAGAANPANIQKNLLPLSSKGATAVRAIVKASNRYATKEISKRGFQGVINLFGKTAIIEAKTAVNETMKMLFRQAARNIFIYTPFANMTQGALNYAYNVWGAI